jgi:hypothetical protein
MNGVPGMIRTCDLRFRKPLLYPAELRGLLLCFLSLFARLASSLCWLLSGVAVAQAATVPACFPQGGFEARDVLAKTAKEIALTDKGILLLAGIEVPDFLEARTLSRVNELIAQKNLRYVPVTAKPDRYQRIVADAAVDSLWLQGTLVGEGLALSLPAGLKSACAAELMQVEKTARANKAGVWSQPISVQIETDDKEALQKLAGKFAIIEGKVLNVGARDYATFINFGKNYRQDFAVIVAKKSLASVEAKQALAALKGKRVRVRGIVEAGPAPRLHLEDPLALEVLE